MRAAALGLVLALALALPGVALADTYFAVKGGPAPGPAKYDKTWVAQTGPTSARNVLVLVPGTEGAAGSLTFVARDIQAALGPNWQVWVQDRRQVVFHDLRGFAPGDVQSARDYYIGFKYRQTYTKDVPFTRRWGLRVALGDLHQIVKRARAGGKRRVVLGGHSLGASNALAYASWDFAGRPGYRNLAGLVLIDGGMMGAFGNGASLAQVKREMRSIERGEAFTDVLGIGNTSIAQVFGTVAAFAAVKDPNAASVIQPNPIVPAVYRPPFPTTNLAFFANIFDNSPSPSLKIRAGTFAAEGDPRGWADGEVTPSARFAAAFAQTRPTFSEWYFPRRLALDTFSSTSMRRDRVSNFLGLRTWHTKKIDVPMYAYQTDLTQGRVLVGARNVKNASRIPRLVEVDESAGSSHLDMLAAPPQTNRFTQTVVPFLQSLFPS